MNLLKSANSKQTSAIAKIKVFDVTALMYIWPPLGGHLCASVHRRYGNRLAAPPLS